MLDALRREAERLADERPAALVVVSARWISPGPFQVDTGRRHRTLTDYAGFGVEMRYDCDGHPGLARELVDAGARAGVRVGPAERGVDSGATVPLHFLAPGKSLRVVPLSVALRPAAECRAWGDVIRRVLAARPEPITLVIGGSAFARARVARREFRAGRLDQRLLEAMARRPAAAAEARSARAAERDCGT